MYTIPPFIISNEILNDNDFRLCDYFDMKYFIYLNSHSVSNDTLYSELGFKKDDIHKWKFQFEKNFVPVTKIIGHQLIYFLEVHFDIYYFFDETEDFMQGEDMYYFEFTEYQYNEGVDLDKEDCKYIYIRRDVVFGQEFLKFQSEKKDHPF